MLAVGVGIAPMIRVLRAIFDENNFATKDIKVNLLYGVKDQKDILMKDFLEEMQEKSVTSSPPPPPTALPFPLVPSAPPTSSAATITSLNENCDGATQPLPKVITTTSSPSSSSSSSSIGEDGDENNTGGGQTMYPFTPTAPSEKRPSFGSPRSRSSSKIGQGNGKKGERRFKVVYCVGSRWNNIVIGALTNQPKGPELEKKIEGLEKDKTEVGWVDEEKIKKYGFPPAKDTMVLVCGLPAVYDKICGPRCSSSLSEYSALKNLGYSDEMVLKF